MCAFSEQEFCMFNTGKILLVGLSKQNWRWGSQEGGTMTRTPAFHLEILETYTLGILILSFFIKEWIFFKYLFIFIFWLHQVLIAACGLRYPMACGIPVLQPGNKPELPALEGRLLTTGPQGKSLGILIFTLIFKETLSLIILNVYVFTVANCQWRG